MSTDYATSGGLSRVAADPQELAPVIVAFASPAPQARLKACKGELGCAEGLDRTVAATFGTATLIASVAHTGGIFAKLAAVPSATKYISEARSSGLQTALDQTNQDYANLGHALNL